MAGVRAPLRYQQLAVVLFVAAVVARHFHPADPFEELVGAPVLPHAYAMLAVVLTTAWFLAGGMHSKRWEFTTVHQGRSAPTEPSRENQHRLAAVARRMITALIHDWVNFWWPTIGQDNADFPNHITRLSFVLLSHLGLTLEPKLTHLVQRVVCLLRVKLRQYRKAHDSVLGATRARGSHEHRLWFQELWKRDQLHIAGICDASLLPGRVSQETVTLIERDYLRGWTDILLRHVLPANEYNSALVRHFLRELLTAMVWENVVVWCTPDGMNNVFDLLEVAVPAPSAPPTQLDDEAAAPPQPSDSNRAHRSGGRGSEQSSASRGSASSATDHKGGGRGAQGRESGSSNSRSAQHAATRGKGNGQGRPQDSGSVRQPNNEPDQAWRSEMGLNEQRMFSRVVDEIQHRPRSREPRAPPGEGGQGREGVRGREDRMQASAAGPARERDARAHAAQQPTPELDYGHEFGTRKRSDPSGEHLPPWARSRENKPRAASAAPLGATPTRAHPLVLDGVDLSLSDNYLLMKEVGRKLGNTAKTLFSKLTPVEGKGTPSRRPPPPHRSESGRSFDLQHDHSRAMHRYRTVGDIDAAQFQADTIPFPKLPAYRPSHELPSTPSPQPSPPPATQRLSRSPSVGFDLNGDSVVPAPRSRSGSKDDRSGWSDARPGNRDGQAAEQVLSMAALEQDDAARRRRRRAQRRKSRNTLVEVAAEAQVEFDKRVRRVGGVDGASLNQQAPAALNIPVGWLSPLRVGAGG